MKWKVELYRPPDGASYKPPICLLAYGKRYYHPKMHCTTTCAESALWVRNILLADAWCDALNALPDEEQPPRIEDL